MNLFCLKDGFFPSSLQFFLPLCGKAGDIIWLYNKGHRVMGIEGSAKAINEFFTENQIPFSIVNISASCDKYLVNKQTTHFPREKTDFLLLSCSPWTRRFKSFVATSSNLMSNGWATLSWIGFLTVVPLSLSSLKTDLDIRPR